MILSLHRPLPDGQGRVSQWFGSNPAAYKRFGLAGHNGLDYAVPVGAPVLATHDGRIETRQLDPDGYGLYVKVIGAICQTLYAHLSVVAGLDGDEVRAGQEIGRSGNTGNSTGPHLHFGLRISGMRNPAYADYVDPFPFRDI